MTKFKDSGNLAKTIQDLSGTKPEIIKDFNYLMPTLQKLYNLIQPSFTTIQTNNVVFFNSNEQADDNAYPIQLVDLYHNASPTFSSLIDLRRNMLIGNGLQPLVASGDTLYQPTVEFLNKENQFGQTLQDIWQMMCFDYSLGETYALECLFSPKGKGTVAEIIHHDFTTVRAVANPNPSLPYPLQYQLSRNWGTTNKTGKYVKTATSGIPIASWNPVRWAEDGGRQLLVCKRYSAGNEVYSIPSYNSILAYVQLDAELANYNLNSVTKGFTPTSIVVLAGNPSKKEKDEFVNKFKNRYVGSNGERTLFIWTNSPDEKPQILPFNTVDNTPMVELLDKILTAKIASGMGANAELAGVQTNGNSLQSDLNKLAVAYNYYYTTHIQVFQKEMLQALNKVMRLNGLSDLTVVTPPLKLETPETQSAPVPQANNNVKNLMQ